MHRNGNNRFFGHSSLHISLFIVPAMMKLWLARLQLHIAYQIKYFFGKLGLFLHPEMLLYAVPLNGSLKDIPGSNTHKLHVYIY